jgi:predicted heme/steroid binding protein
MLHPDLEALPAEGLHEGVEDAGIGLSEDVDPEAAVGTGLDGNFRFVG